MNCKELTKGGAIWHNQAVRMKITSKIISVIFLFALFLIVNVLVTSPIFANHSWGGYHWAATVSPFTLKLGDNVSSIWDPILATTSTDWSVSSVLDTAIVRGGTSPRFCRSTLGQVEVCSSRYGYNGWLGMAQIWVNTNKHILKATTKVNDTYFNTKTYNTTAWRNLVMCQEVGHVLGLDHQDEDFDNGNLNTCMDYSNDPESNQHPNLHDYDELALIYAHLDSATTLSQKLAQSIEGNFENPSEWGKLLNKKGRVALFERNLGFGNKLFTFVIYTEQ